MLIFKLERTEEFLEATTVLAGISRRCHFKLSKAMFSLYVIHHSLRCNIALQIIPDQFFTTYNFFDQNPHSSFFIDTFFLELLILQRIGCSSLTFHLAQFLPLAEIISEHPGLTRTVIELPLSHPAAGERAATEIDFTIFVSIEVQDFKPIAAAFDQAPYVRVALTDSQVTFSYEDSIFALTKEENQCIIGGVAAEDRVQIILTPIPVTAFSNMTALSKRVWIFKSNQRSNAVLTAPIGLNARFFVYLPQLM